MLLLILLIGCATLKPISGGVTQPDGKFLIDTGVVQITITRAAVGTQLGRLEVILKNISDSPIEVDYLQSIITTDSGEQLQPLGPEQATASISTDAFSVGLVGSNKAHSATDSARGEVSRVGIGKFVIQQGGFVKGAFFFRPPLTPYKFMTFQFNGIHGSPKVSLGAH